MFCRNHSLFSIVVPLLLTFLSATAFASDGYQDTARWWQSVEQRTEKHSHELQSLYSQVEAATSDRRGLNRAFCQALVSRYSGSVCNPSSGFGVLSAPGHLSISFNFKWEISKVKQRVDGLTMTYHLGRDTYEITDGSNYLTLKIDSRSPQNSRFTGAIMPALSATASDLWNKNPQKKTSISPLLGILNDAYALRAHEGAERLDLFAEKFLTDLHFRNSVVNTVRTAYFGDQYRQPVSQIESKPVAAQRSPLPSVKPKNQDLASAFLTGIFNGIGPFLKVFAMIGLFLFLLSALTAALKVWAGKTATGYARKGAQKGLVWLIREILALWMKREEKCRFKSQGNLLTEAEKAFFQVLDQALEGKGYHIALKPRLADIIRVADRTGKQGLIGFRKITQKHLDFVILEKSTSRIIGAVELDDGSHARRDRQERDRFVEDALQQAGIPLYRQPWQRAYSVASLSALQRTFFPESNAGPEWDISAPAWVGQEWE